MFSDDAGISLANGNSFSMDARLAEPCNMLLRLLSVTDCRAFDNSR